MRSRSLITLTFLLSLGALFAAGNLWIAAARSTIPVALDEIVVAKETRKEKHPGKDDVYFLYFQSGRAMHVDRLVFEHVQEQDQLRKEAWSRLLEVGGKELDLELSPDFRGMQYAMPGILLVFLVTAIFSARATRTSNPGPQNDRQVSPA